MAGALEAALRFGSYKKGGNTLVEGLEPGAHRNCARIDGRIADLIRAAAQWLRDVVCGRSRDRRGVHTLSGKREGMVVLPTGSRYAAAARREG